MIIKSPPCYDISHYETVTNFSAISPRPLLMITKATEGGSITDGKFVEYFAGMKSAEIVRGCYHFFRKVANITTQANLFINTVQAQVNNNDWLILDVEEGGESAVQLKAWLDIVRARFPANPFMIYSRKNILDPIGMTQEQKDYFKQIPTWTAGYPYNPDIYSTIPPMYVPDQTKWGECLLWQYTDKGIVGGISGATDLNYMTPQMIMEIEPPSVNTDTHTNTHVGVDVYKLTRFGTTVYVHVIDPKVAKVMISSCGFRTPLQAMNIYKADVVSNAGGWPKVQTAGYRSNEIWASNGEIIQAVALDDRPYINISRDGIIVVSPNDKLLPDLYNAGGYDRLLLWEGVYNSRADDNADGAVKDARTFSGVTSDNKLVLCNAEGNDQLGFGLTYFEMYQVLREFGVINGGNNDGGSSTCVRNNAISDEPLFIGSGDSDGNTEAYVINHVLVFGGGVPPPNGGSMPVPVIPTIVAKANRAINIKAVDGVPSGAVAQLPIGGLFYGDWNSGKTDVIYGRSRDGLKNGFYRPSGEFVDWGSEAIKIAIGDGNATITSYTTTPPPADPPPVPPTNNNVEVLVSIVNDVVTVKVDGITYVKQ